MENCVFCKIARGEIPSFKIWEDENYFAFLDANPIGPGHTLVIPKNHTDYLFDISEEEYCGLMSAAKKIAEILKEKFNSKRVGLLIDGFGVSHANVHLLPVNMGGMVCLQNAKHATADELKKVADKILQK